MVIVRNAGVRYGRVCLGDGDDDDNSAVIPECPTMLVNYTKLGDGLALYNITVDAPEPVGTRAVFFDIQFDADITSIEVKSNDK